jgi:hypothetical protein
MPGVFCIGSANGDGIGSSFNPPDPDIVKFSAVGEGVIAAYTSYLKTGARDIKRKVRNDGTSTATPCAAGIACLLLDYLSRFVSRDKLTYDNMKKIFIKISTATVGYEYRFLAPWFLFDDVPDPEKYIKEILERPAGSPISQELFTDKNVQICHVFHEGATICNVVRVMLCSHKFSS